MPNSGSPIRWAELQTEFGGSNPVSMSEYYRGGAFVNSALTAVPASGQIAISQFYGLSAFDPIPDALNWADLVNSSNLTSTQTITGISSSITLRIEITANSIVSQSPDFGDGFIEIIITKNGNTYDQFFGLTGNQLTQINTSQTYIDVPVNNGDTIALTLNGSPGSGGSTSLPQIMTIAVKNASSSFTTLDAFDINAQTGFN
jgi:hypothetical protein